MIAAFFEFTLTFSSDLSSPYTYTIMQIEPTPFWARKPVGLLIPLLLHAALVFSTLSNAYIFHQDENYYMNSTRAMLEQGEYLVPSYNNVPRINKPIGFYWLMLPAQAVFGHGFASTRMISWLASLGMMVVVYALSGFVFSDEKRRALTVWILASMDAYYRYAHYAVPEMTLTLFMACAHWAAWRWLHTQRKRDLVLMYLAAGLAFDVKGPVGVLLPFAATGAYLFLNQRKSEIIRLFSLPGFLLLLAITTPWYIALMAALGPMRMLDMMGKETAGRIFSLENSPVYYLPVLLIYFAPWTWFPLARFSHWLRKGNRTAFWQACKQSYPFIWFASYALFYSLLVGEKHQWYALQWAPPLAILCAQVLLPLNEERLFNRMYLFWGILCVVAAHIVIGLHILLGDIVCSGSAGVMVYLWLSLSVFGLALTRTPASRIISIAACIMVLHWLVLNVALPSKQFHPVTKFAIELQQQDQPFDLLANERYFQKNYSCSTSPT